MGLRDQGRGGRCARGGDRLTYLLDSPTYGGAERYLIHHLERLPGGYQVTVVGTDPVPRQLADAARTRGRLVVVPPVGARWGRAADLRRVLVATRPDLIHVNLIDPRSNRVLLAAAAACAVPAVATVHMIGVVGQGPSRLALAAIYRRLAAVVAPSRQIAGLVSDRFGVASTRLVHVRNGVEVVDRAVRAPSRSGGAQGGLLRVGGLGRLTRQKGFDLLIAATRRLLRVGHRFEVVIAGEGREQQRLAAAAAGLPVRLVGFSDDVGSFLTGLDLLCVPSRAEALPLALLEGMMVGVPCVAAAVGDIAAEVADAALVVPPGDVDALTSALGRLLTDADLRATLSRRARLLARERFTADAMVAATEGVYRRVLRR